MKNTNLQKVLKLGVISLLLVSFMLTAVACAVEEAPPSDGTEATTTVQGTVTTADPTLDENGYKKDNLPEDLNYGDRVFNLLVSETQSQYNFADSNDESLLGSALYSRQVQVEERLGIELNLIKRPGDYSTSSSFCNAVYMAKYSNLNTYDLVAAYNLTPPVMAQMGLSRDLCEEDSYVDFDMPWWGKEAYESIAINGKVYFMTDNSSWNSIKNMLALYINHDLAKKYNVDVTAIYDLVAEKKWTMSEMFSLCENVYDDTDLDGVKSDGDTFGLSTGNSVWNEGWYYGAGFVSTEINNDSSFSFTLSEPEVIDFLDWFNLSFHNKNSVQTVDSEQYKAFNSERAMFYYSAIAVTLQDISFDMSAVPTPMYKADQGRYYTHFSNTYDMWCIPVTTADYECSSAVLECLSSEAFRIIAPACYDVYLKVRKSTDDRAGAMYDVIRDSIVFDFGYVYGLCFSNEQTTIHVRRYINGNSSDWVSQWQSLLPVYTSEVEAILNKLK